MVISELTANIDTSKKELFVEEKGEKFYQLPIQLSTCEIIALLSEFLIKETNGKAALKGYLRSSVVKEPREHLFTYFRVTEMNPVTDDTPLTNRVDISGRITKIGELKTLRTGKQVLPIIISRMSDDGNTSILHAVLYEAHARQLNSKRDSQFNITASGIILAKNSAIEVGIDELTLTERK